MAKAKGQLVAYVRVSTLEQNTQRQEEELSRLHPDRVFIDKASGKDVARPELQAAIQYLRDGDVLVVYSMDRLARNLDDLRAIVRTLNSKGVEVRFVKESLSFTGDDSPMSNLLLSVLGAFSEFERSLIRERQREGIELAKRRGVYRGRKPSLNEEAKVAIRAKVAEGISKTKIAQDHGISRETLYQFLRLDAEAKGTNSLPSTIASS